MKEVLLKGNKKSFYPRKVYCYKSVIDSLRKCVSSSTFQENCEKWKKRNIPADIFSDVTDGKVWKDFQHFVQKKGAAEVISYLAPIDDKKEQCEDLKKNDLLKQELNNVAGYAVLRGGRFVALGTWLVQIVKHVKFVEHAVKQS